jgi:hypothetical protein
MACPGRLDILWRRWMDVFSETDTPPFADGRTVIEI